MIKSFVIASLLMVSVNVWASEGAAPGMHVTWSAYEGTVKTLAEKIHTSNWEFDHIVVSLR